MAEQVLNHNQQVEIYERIKAFHFDLDGPAFPFVSRLARENGWTESYALRVMAEYRRFVFLALAAGHPVSPSDPVDQAWHLHLLDTDSYWRRFCEETLGQPFHHEPTKGGAAERAKFAGWYEATIQSYRRYFGEDPRFANIHFERVNRDLHFVVSKMWVTGTACAVVAGALLTWFS
jgi:hypothetical protein